MVLSFFILSWILCLVPASPLGSLTVGSKIPDSPSHLPMLDGTEISLSDEGRPTVLCFLRHLAWLPWHDHVEALCKLSQDFEEVNCRILFVCSNDPSKRLHRIWIEGWLQKFNVTLLLDPTKMAYKAYSIKSSTAAAFGFANCWYYFKAILLRGRRSIAIHGDAGQLGADFVVAPGGTVVVRHYCRNPTDRIKVTKLLEAVYSLRDKNN